MVVRVINKSAYELPSYETPLAAGMDVRADIAEEIVELPAGYEMQVRPRSGLAAKHGVTVLNAPGTVDADYRGEIKVILVNLSDTPFGIKPGERIAQIVVARHERVEWELTEALSDTVRGAGGFGSTGR